MLSAQTSILSQAEATEHGAMSQSASGASGTASFLRTPWERFDEHGARSHGVTAVLEAGLAWEKAAASVSVINGRLSAERAESLSEGAPGEAYASGEPYRACALSLVFHARSPLVPTLRGDVRLFEVPGRQERWYGGGADLTPCYLFEEDARDFHRFWRNMCREVMEAEEAAPERCGDIAYAEMKRACDDYFYIPARKEHRGVGGIFFDRIPTSVPWATHEIAERLLRRVADGMLAAYLPIVARRQGLPVTAAMREWQLQRRGRYVEFNLLYDRGVRFGLSQLEKVMVSAPPLVAWPYRGPGSAEPEAADLELLQVLRAPRDWGFDVGQEGELSEFLGDGEAEGGDHVRVRGVLPRKLVVSQRLRMRGIGVLVLEESVLSTAEERSWRILCHHRSASKATYADRWDMLVGGIPHPGEPSGDAAARELHEELGIDRAAMLGDLRPLGIVAEVSTVVRVRVELFGCIVPTGTRPVPLDGEATEVEWRTVGEVREELADETRRGRWVDSGVQTWETLEAAGGPALLVQLASG